MAFCLHCGQRLAEGAANCAACGAAVEAAHVPQEPAAAARSIDPGLTDKVRQLAREGQKIQAIKEYRETTGASLGTAKDAVESWLKSEGLATSSGAGCGTSVLLLLMLGIGALCGLR